MNSGPINKITVLMFFAGALADASASLADPPIGNPQLEISNQDSGSVSNVDKYNRRAAYNLANGLCNRTARRAQIYMDNVPQHFFQFRCRRNVSLSAWLRGDNG